MEGLTKRHHLRENLVNCECVILPKYLLWFPPWAPAGWEMMHQGSQRYYTTRGKKSLAHLENEGAGPMPQVSSGSERLCFPDSWRPTAGSILKEKHSVTTTRFWLPFKIDIQVSVYSLRCRVSVYSLKRMQPHCSFLFNSTWLRDKEHYKWQVSVVYI